MNYNVLILTTSRAPYRVELFNELGKKVNLEVIFEEISDKTRNNEWYLTNNYNYKSFSFENTKFYKSCQVISKKLKEERFDIIIFYEFSTKLSVYTILLCQALKIPYIINCDGYVYLNDNKLKKTFKKILIGNASGLIAGGNKAKEYFKYYGGLEKNIHVINFTSIFKKDILKEKIVNSRKREIKQKYGLPLDCKIVMTVGRFIALKNIEMLIDVWPHLSRSYNLVIIGEGELENKYIEKIKENNLENIQIFGFKSKKELFEIYSVSDLLVHPSKYDVWGLVINEAMANGLPVIASNKTVAANELIKNGINGFVVDPNNSKEYVDKISKVLSDTTLRENIFFQNTLLIQKYTHEESAELIFRAIYSTINK